MTENEIKALMKGMAPVIDKRIKAYSDALEAALGELVKRGDMRMASLERRIEELEEQATKP